jgi:hypothetical protein
MLEMSSAIASKSTIMLKKNIKKEKKKRRNEKQQQRASESSKNDQALNSINLFTLFSAFMLNKKI